jgi:hypothetical protein
MAINEGMANSVELLGHYGSDLVHAQSQLGHQLHVI